MMQSAAQTSNLQACLVVQGQGHGVMLYNERRLETIAKYTASSLPKLGSCWLLERRVLSSQLRSFALKPNAGLICASHKLVASEACAPKSGASQRVKSEFDIAVCALALRPGATWSN